MAKNIEKLTWKKSSYSAGNGGSCVEVAVTAAALKVRDSKDPNGPQLTFSMTGWTAFVEGVKNGQFDLKSE